MNDSESVMQLSAYDSGNIKKDTMLNLLQSSPITEDNTNFRQFDDHDEESDEYDEESSSSGEEEEERKGNEQQEIPGVPN